VDELSVLGGAPHPLARFVGDGGLADRAHDMPAATRSVLCWLAFFVPDFPLRSLMDTAARS